MSTVVSSQQKDFKQANTRADMAHWFRHSALTHLDLWIVLSFLLYIYTYKCFFLLLVLEFDTTFVKTILCAKEKKP